MFEYIIAVLQLAEVVVAPFWYLFLWLPLIGIGLLVWRFLPPGWREWIETARAPWSVLLLLFCVWAFRDVSPCVTDPTSYGCAQERRVDRLERELEFNEYMRLQDEAHRFAEDLRREEQDQEAQ